MKLPLKEIEPAVIRALPLKSYVPPIKSIRLAVTFEEPD
jgi:hypothetical protein